MTTAEFIDMYSGRAADIYTIIIITAQQNGGKVKLYIYNICPESMRSISVSSFECDMFKVSHNWSIPSAAPLLLCHGFKLPSFKESL